MRGLHELATSLGLTHLQLTIRDGQRLEDFYGRFGYRVVGRPRAIRIGSGEYRDEVMSVAPMAPDNPPEPTQSGTSADQPLDLAGEGSTAQLNIEQLAGPPQDSVCEELAKVLLDCVAGGASLGFLGNLTHLDAQQWWRSYLADPQVLTWVARDPASNRIVGTVSLELADKANGPHMAEIAKLMVHREARGRSCGTRLLATAEEKARDLGRSLLFLDTESGSLADQLYSRRGW